MGEKGDATEVQLSRISLFFWFLSLRARIGGD